ncbi:chromosomal replication initiator protein DnaA [Desulfurivibrio dismutans]|uniref:chromosomal replication initiator protein DnaA n=1 Tax=Desulfurivibrio dismutans TaxID=1398908 RepID=UPI0023DCB621|nr:chromosomal replication initiator protein DnaA [Desulfurivibrio alkaliphilus]MDF1614213.1 chromosomal replication initiator protein DnaA [Desulfurivibrio alkaliphilus]
MSMIWPEVRKILQHQLPESVFNLWVEPLRCLAEDNQTLELAGPDRFFCSWVADHYLAAMQEALGRLERPGIRISFRVDPDLADDRAADEAGVAGGGKEQLRLPQMPKGRPRIRTLHPRYTFDEFMVGESNALAFSACEAIAAGAAEAEPCVFINAGTGLGKSHLAHAVAHHLYNYSPSTRLCCLTSQQLTAELVRHIRSNTMDQFKEKFQRQCDVLLVEDVQTLSGRGKTQVELAEAVDCLLENGRRVLFTGAVGPREIPDLDDGVRSRLAAGLVTSINPPDMQTRRLITRRKADYHKLILDEEMVEYMAEKVRGDVRRLESAIVGLKAKANLRKAPPTMAMVKEVVATVVVGGDDPGLSAEAIRDFVAAQFQVSVDELQSKSRKKDVAFPRQVSMYLARKLTDEALAGIGKVFNRDHSTVVHSIRVITEAVARNGSVRGQVEHLTDKLKQRQK